MMPSLPATMTLKNLSLSEKAAAAGAIAHSNEHGTDEDEANTVQMRLNIVAYLLDAIIFS